MQKASQYEVWALCRVDFRTAQRELQDAIEPRGQTAGGRNTMLRNPPRGYIIVLMAATASQYSNDPAMKETDIIVRPAASALVANSSWSAHLP